MSYRVLRVLAAAALTALLVGFVGVASYTFGVLQGGPAQPRVFAAPSGAMARQITAVGRGQIKIAPDVALAQLGVRTEGEALKAALDANNAQMAAVIAKLKELGIAETDIQTSNISIEPRFSRETGQPMPGYQVSNVVAVTIRDVGRAGAILDQALGAGANQLMGFSFGAADQGAAEQSARDKAIADARARAEAMAAASGATIGQVLSISEEPGMVSPAYVGMPAAAPAAGMPIQPGQQAIEAQLQVTFELK